MKDERTGPEKKISAEKEQQQHQRTFCCVGCVAKKMFCSGWWPTQMVQWTKLLLISIVIDSPYFFCFKKNSEKNEEKKQQSLCCLVVFLLYSAWPTTLAIGLNIAILHVVLSNIYETLRWKNFCVGCALFIAIVCMCFSVCLIEQILFALLCVFDENQCWCHWLPLSTIIRPSLTNHKIPPIPLPQHLIIFIVALEKRCYTLFI